MRFQKDSTIFSLTWIELAGERCSHVNDVALHTKEKFSYRSLKDAGEFEEYCETWH